MRKKTPNQYPLFNTTWFTICLKGSVSSTECQERLDISLTFTGVRANTARLTTPSPSCSLAAAALGLRRPHLVGALTLTITELLEAVALANICRELFF